MRGSGDWSIDAAEPCRGRACPARRGATSTSRSPAPRRLGRRARQASPPHGLATTAHGAGLRAYVLRRVLTAIPLLLVISIACLALMQLAPGGPLAGMEGSPNIRAEDIEIKRKLLGLDKP